MASETLTRLQTRLASEATAPLQVTVIRDPDDLPSTQDHLRHLNDPDSGVLVIRHVPYLESFPAFTLTVLAGLGKTLPAKTAREPWNQAVAWASGYRLEHIVVDRAHTLHPMFTPHLLALIKTPRPRLPRLWLIDASRSTRRRSIITDFQAPTPAMDDVEVTVAGPAQLRHIHARRRDPPTRPGQPEQLIPDELPTDSFMTFRAACVRSLDPDTAAQVDAVWVKAFTDIRNWAPRHRDLTAVHQAPAALALPLSLYLAARTYQAYSDGEALVRLRATQAGLLQCGLLLHHHAWPGQPRLGSHLTPTATSAVNRVQDTQEAAAAILYLLFPYDRRAMEKHWHPHELTLADFTPTASTVRINSVDLPVPAHARPALLAQLTLRRLQGADSSAAYFNAPLRDVRLLAHNALAHTTAAGDLREDTTARPDDEHHPTPVDDAATAGPAQPRRFRPRPGPQHTELDMNHPSTLGGWLLAHARDHGLTNSELADILGLPIHRIRQITTTDLDDLPVRTLAALAERLELDWPEWLPHRNHPLASAPSPATTAPTRHHHRRR